MDWRTLDKKLWQAEKELARSLEYHGDYRIFASDIDPKAVAIARANAERAGVDGLIRFEQADAAAFARETERGVIVTNPPYGERIGEKEEAEALYRAFGAAYRKSPTGSSICSPPTRSLSAASAGRRTKSGSCITV